MQAIVTKGHRRGHSMAMMCTWVLLLTFVMASPSQCSSGTASQERLVDSFVQATGVRLKQTSTVQPSNVFFLVRTWHKNYESLVPAVLDTWASGLDQNSLLIVGDRPDPKGRIVEVQNCGSEFGFGPACRTASGIVRALAQKSWDWLFVADDDAYVSTARVAETLQAKNHTQAQIFGVLGCSDCSPFGLAQSGLCGGGGYALSRKAVEELFPRGEADVRGVFLSIVAKVTGNSDDVSVACYAHSKGVKLHPLDNLYAWHLDAEDNFTDAYADKIRCGALSLHYLDSDEMHAVHTLYSEARKMTGKQPKEDGEMALLHIEDLASQTYQRDRDEYLGAENERRASNIWPELVSPRVPDWF